MQESVEINDEEAVDDNLFKSLRGLLIFGRVIGMLPYKGVFSNSSVNLKFMWLSVPSLISSLIITVLTFNSILEIFLSAKSSKKNAYEIVQSVRSTLYHVWGTIIYLNFILRANSFLNIFKAWRSCTTVFFTKPDHHLKRDVVLISVVILVSGTLENSLYYVGYAKDIFTSSVNSSGDLKQNSTLQQYYSNSHKSWAKYIPYNPVIPVLAFIQHKCVLFGWNYMDILIALLGRALYFRFKSLHESVDEMMVQPTREKPIFTDTPKSAQFTDGQGWIQLTKDHRALCDLLLAFENFLSPLIFISYMVNIYYICMQLLDGLTVDIHSNSWTDAVNKPWSFLHLVMRIYVVSICCAKVNMYAHHIRNAIQDCPATWYKNEIARLDKKVSGAREIGLSGLGCFTVTYPFILTFIGVVFTFEIVLLQVFPSPQQTGGGQACCCK